MDIKNTKIKVILILFLILSQLKADSLDQNKSRSCSVIINKINLLEDEKVYTTSAKIVALLFNSGSYSYEASNEEANMKIRILKVELSECE